MTALLLSTPAGVILPDTDQPIHVLSHATGWLDAVAVYWRSGSLGILLLGALGLAIWGFFVQLRKNGRRLKAASEANQILADYGDELMLGIEPDGRLNYAAPVVAETLGWLPEELQGQRCSDLLHPEDRLPFEIALDTIAKGPDQLTISHRLRNRDGAFIWYESHCRKVKGSKAGAKAALVMVSRNVSRERQTEAKLAAATSQIERLSRTDRLTGIANRRWFDETVSCELIRATRSTVPVSLLIVDIDRLQLYNELAGFEAGNDCLQQIATIVDLSARRPGDFSGRYSGGSIALILPETDIAGAVLLAEQIRAAISDLKLPIDEHRTVTASVGSACIVPGKTGDRTSLMNTAERAVQTAKKAGRNTVRVAPIRPDHVTVSRSR